MAAPRPGARVLLVSLRRLNPHAAWCAGSCRSPPSYAAPRDTGADSSAAAAGTANGRASTRSSQISRK